MSAVTPMLRNIDAEIAKHRQEIAKHRLWIQQLEDTRLTLMTMEENAAAMNGHVSPFGALPPGFEIAARENTHPKHAEHVALLEASEAGSLTVAAKLGIAIPKPGKTNRGIKGPRVRGALRNKVLEMLSDTPGLTASHISNYLGIPAGEANRRPLSNALYQMKGEGMIENMPGTAMGSGTRPTYRLTQAGQLRWKTLQEAVK